MTNQDGEYDAVAPLSERDASSPTRESLRSCALNVARSLGLVERSSRVIEQSRVSLGDTAAAAGRLDELARESAALRDALRNAVWSCVIDLKAHQAPPQDVLVVVKHDVGDATRSVLQQHEADVLVSEAVQWAIDAYYRASGVATFPAAQRYSRSVDITGHLPFSDGGPLSSRGLRAFAVA